MGTVRVPVTAELEDGKIINGLADQRDFAAAEGANIVRERAPLTWVRYVTWHALHRTGTYQGNWEAFTEQCVEAYDGEQEEPAGDDAGLDPGQPATTAGS
jgi:hypothetical protein